MSELTFWTSFSDLCVAFSLAACLVDTCDMALLLVGLVLRVISLRTLHRLRSYTDLNWQLLFLIYLTKTQILGFLDTSESSFVQSLADGFAFIAVVPAVT